MPGRLVNGSRNAELQRARGRPCRPELSFGSRAFFRYPRRTHRPPPGSFEIIGALRCSLVIVLCPAEARRSTPIPATRGIRERIARLIRQSFLISPRAREQPLATLIRLPLLPPS